MTATTTRHPILDESGKARAWLDAGRGIAVWVSHDIGAGRPDMLTPGDVDVRPHWAYVKDRTLQTADDVVFYHPVRIVKSWNDSPQGNRAALLALDSDAYKDTTREAPAGTFATSYTLKRYAMGSITIRPEADGGTTVLYRSAHENVPTLLDVEFRVGILQWSAQTDGQA